jgi:hypothetical protein
VELIGVVQVQTDLAVRHLRNFTSHQHSAEYGCALHDACRKKRPTSHH